MPQLDVDLFDDFLFFAFAALLFGFGEQNIEEDLIEQEASSAVFSASLWSGSLYRAERACLRALYSRPLLGRA